MAASLDGPGSLDGTGSLDGAGSGRGRRGWLAGRGRAGNEHPVTRRTVAVVSAGLGQPSSTRLLADKLAAATARGLPPGTEIVTVELRELAHDIVNNLLTGFPGPALGQAIGQVVRADGLIAVTPLYSGSYNGLFKSFFDVLEADALAGQPVLIAATGGTPRHSLALEHALRPLFSYLRAVTVPTAVSRPPRTGARAAAPTAPSPPGSRGPGPSWPPRSASAARWTRHP